MKAYADIAFYANEYLCNAGTRIPEDKFPYYAMRATKEISARTFGNTDRCAQVPEEARMCCCEVAEKLYDLDCAKSGNGMVLQSYSNDGDSGTFQAADMTASGMEAAVTKIVRGWLLGTGLMFCGRGKRDEPKL